MNTIMVKKAVEFCLSASYSAFLPSMDKMIAPLITIHPEWGIIWGCAIGLYSLYLFYQQDKLNEVIEFIQQNPSKFIEENISSDYFRGNFLKFLRDYLLQENNAKKQALKQIILGTLQKNKTRRYEIDRLNNVLNQISIDAMKNLVWISHVILPLIESEVEKELLVFKEKDPRQLRRLEEQTRTRKSVSTYIEKWIYDNYSPNSEKVKYKKKALTINGVKIIKRFGIMKDGLKSMKLRNRKIITGQNMLVLDLW